ncbi:tellurite resistance/C4-dicarboxylate transporter family protein [Rhodoblastus sp.]|jgi:tellurite resistance protein TehA-like permease|uniref:tellurite resistance/C4-dicarboxylate transporter family protein n=1 Tax=Rhodoblastus sp. TaxID=1962975 RepID=UPI00260081CB|nr:tellurite resistance/C4-dicarboxylate transporter family protein [Rhodoblastus sp.]
MKNLPPAYFALTMATGIISIGAWNFHFFWLAISLFVFNLAAYVALSAMTVARAVRYPSLVFADMTDHRIGPGFFTTVAGSAIVGTQFFHFMRETGVAMAFLGLGALLWIGLTYTIFTAFTVKREKPSLEKGITGGWLIAVVATQSIAVLTSLVSRDTPQPYRVELNFVALSMWLWGGMFYSWIISLIFYRYTFFPFSPGDLAPPYWINMGAMAISTLAGAQLIQNTPDAPFLLSLLPFLKGFTVFYWATATWWIPMLFVLGVWRHLYRKFPFQYDPLYWGAVFPLGMYSAATAQMSIALDLPFLMPISWIMFLVALVVWIIVFVGLLSQLLSDFRVRWA